MRIRVLCFLGKKHRQVKLFRKKRKTESYNVIQEGRRSFMTMMMKLVPVFAIAALLFAVYLAMKVSRQEAGTKKMKEISDAISEGARAFLMVEYKILVVFVIVLFVLIGVGTRSIVTAICFVAGAAFSTLAGYFGMQMATKANVRTANAAMKSGMNRALSIALSGGAGMGVCVAGRGVLGVSVF